MGVKRQDLYHNSFRELSRIEKNSIKNRIEKYFQEINKSSVIFRWKYKMDEITIA